jgi:hypothetical protein
MRAGAVTHADATPRRRNGRSSRCSPPTGGCGCGPLGADGAMPAAMPAAGTFQVVAALPEGPTPLALWTVGDVPQLEVDASVTHGAAVIQRLNGLRRAAGRTPLRADPLLARFAQQRAVALAAWGAPAHATAPDDGPLQRLARAGLTAEMLGENVALARSLPYAHARLLPHPRTARRPLDARPRRGGRRRGPARRRRGRGGGVCAAPGFAGAVGNARHRAVWASLRPLGLPRATAGRAGEGSLRTGASLHPPAKGLRLDRRLTTVADAEHHDALGVALVVNHERPFHEAEGRLSPCELHRTALQVSFIDQDQVLLDTPPQIDRGHEVFVCEVAEDLCEIIACLGRVPDGHAPGRVGRFAASIASSWA